MARGVCQLSSDTKYKLIKFARVVVCEIGKIEVFYIDFKPSATSTLVDAYQIFAHCRTTTWSPARFQSVHAVQSHCG